MVKKQKEHRSLRTKAGDLAELGIGIGIVLLVLFIGSFFKLRADLTTEQRYTLTEATQELVTGLNDVVYVRLYLTGALPSDLQKLSQATQDLLDEMRVLAPERIEYSIIDPNESPDEETRHQVYDELQRAGLIYTSLRMREKGALTEQIVFPGALITYQERTVPLQLLKTQLRAPDADMVNRSINNLEYEFASAIRKALSRDRPRIAFLEGHGELDELAVMDITKALEEHYKVSRVRIDERIDALSHNVEGMVGRVNDYDALIIAKPDSTFSQRDRYVIDQFIMYGGKVLWCVDMMGMDMDSLRTNQFAMATPLPLGIDDLLFSYGARINKDLLLDRICAPIEIFTQPYGDQRKLERFPWYFEPVLIPQSTHPIVTNIDPIHTRFISSLDTIAVEGVKKTILLTTSDNSRLLRNPVRVSLGIVQMEMGFDRHTIPHIPVGVLLEGEFTSAFVDRLPAEFTADPEVAFKEKGKRTAQIVISDGDVIANRIDQQKGMYYMLGFDRYANAKIYGNRELILNAMNYLLDDQSLISIRSRNITLRQLDAARIERERTKWQIINVGVPIVLTVIAGLLYNFIRRRRSLRTA